MAPIISISYHFSINLFTVTILVGDLKVRGQCIWKKYDEKT